MLHSQPIKYHAKYVFPDKNQQIYVLHCLWEDENMQIICIVRKYIGYSYFEK